MKASRLGKHKQRADLTIALVGNPNSGKTSLFNALTGSHQRVGNWPGVTVERKTGRLKIDGINIKIIDLPGIYSLAQYDENSIDVQIANDFLAHEKVDLLINIVDASSLERHCYLTTQLAELNIPMIMALNMVDLAEKNHIEINTKVLANAFDCDVIKLNCQKKQGIEQLKQSIIKSYQKPKVPKFTLPYPDNLSNTINQLTNKLNSHSGSRHSAWHQSLQLLESGKHIMDNNQEDVDILIADTRFTTINILMRKVISYPNIQKKNSTYWIDKIVLNRFLGIPIFLFIMYCMFFFAINIGGSFQDFFDLGGQTLFVQGLAALLNHLHSPAWLTAFLASGVGKGINTTITFIPVIGAMFLFLSLLEDSGYMARAAFVMDRFMSAIGLPGKSFVPLIVGFGCNVPAVMAARTLENKRDRILTVLMSPFMACGARLAIFSVFVAAFFPHNGQNIVFALYIIGILAAVITGLILRKTFLQGASAPLIMELPQYHRPCFNNISKQTWRRLKGFLFKAGRFIIPVCIIIGLLNSISIHGNLLNPVSNQTSLLAELGQWLTPIFHPLGIQQDNWPATVGLITGILAKEVVIGTLNTLYMQLGHLAQTGQHVNILGGLQTALMSIPHNLAQLPQALYNPISASAPVHSVTHGVYGQMYMRFDGKIGAFAYLLFVLLYIPCISTTAVTARELGWSWAGLSLIWNTSFAYAVAVIFYQLATINHHISSSLSWSAAMLLLLSGLIILMKYLARVRQHSQQIPLRGNL